VQQADSGLGVVFQIETPRKNVARKYSSYITKGLPIPPSRGSQRSDGVPPVRENLSRRANEGAGLSPGKRRAGVLLEALRGKSPSLYQTNSGWQGCRSLHETCLNSADISFISAPVLPPSTDWPRAVRETAMPRWRSPAGFLLLRGLRRGQCRTIARLIRTRIRLARSILR